jgi:anti-sigma factor ChrR (cupin superfamily)
MTDPPASLYVDAAARAWEERRPGVFWKVLWEDGDRRAVLVRYTAGATIPRHRHLGDEQIFVLEGSVTDDTGTCTAGNYARRPPGCVHTVRSLDGALLLAIMTGGTEPVA